MSHAVDEIETRMKSRYNGWKWSKWKASYVPKHIRRHFRKHSIVGRVTHEYGIGTEHYHKKQWRRK